MAKLKRLMILVLALTAFAPAAQGAVLLPPPCDPAMMQAAHPACCPPGDCDCAVEMPTERSSAVLPMVAPNLDPLSGPSPEDVRPSRVQRSSTTDRSAEEPPPQQSPLYEAYSDYRL